MKKIKIGFVVFITGIMVILFNSCVKKNTIACTGERLVPIKSHRSTAIEHHTSAFLESLKSSYSIPHFFNRQGSEVLVTVSYDTVSTYLSNRFDTIKELNQFALKDHEFLFQTRNGYGIYNDRNRKMYYLQSLFEQPYTITDSLYVPLVIDSKKRYILDKQKIIYLDNDRLKGFLVNYGILKKSNVNYLDDYIFLVSAGDKITTIGRYPRNYTEQYREARNAVYAMDSGSHIYYTLPYTDSMYKLHINGSPSGASEIVACREFNEYTEKDNTDLAYKRKYLATSEQNIALEVVNNKYIVVLRRKNRPDMRTVPEFYIAVFDLNLKKLFLDTIREDITPAIFHYENDIFFLSSDFSKIHEYKIQ